MHKLSLAVACALSGVVSCGLISSDITKTSFDLPPRNYSFDTASLNLPMGNTVEVPCGDGQLVMDCCAPPPPLPAPNCAMTPIICAAGVCTAHVKITQSATIDLGREVPALRDVPSFGSVSISRITYKVQTNTLNIDSPPMELFLAPGGVTDPDDQTANPPPQRFGTIPSIPAGNTDPGMVELAPGAPGIFESFASDVSKPFNFIMRAFVDVPSGSPIPSGKIDLEVSGRLSVSPL